MKINEFGERLAYLRRKKGLNYEGVVALIGMRDVSTNDLRNWERGLAHPNDAVLRKLSQIYDEPYEELLVLHEQTVKAGTEGINAKIIEVISKIMGVSMQTVIVLARILLIMLCVIGILYFMRSMQMFVDFAERGL